MIVCFIMFYVRLFITQIMPSWYQKDFLDPSSEFKHAHFRRFSGRYKAKLRLVKTLWTGTGFLMLVFPTPPILVGGILFSTCLSFAILDESE